MFELDFPHFIYFFPLRILNRKTGSFNNIFTSNYSDFSSLQLAVTLISGLLGNIEVIPLHKGDLKNSWYHTKSFIDYYRSNTEKAMAPHSSTLAWKIPWMEEPGRLQSMGSPRVGHD